VKNIQISGLSDAGMVRDKNEDSLWSAAFKEMAVLVVADGMGGYLGGQMASGIVVQTVKKLFDLNRSRLSPPELIEDSLVLANKKIRELSHSHFEGLTVGSTCVLAVVTPPDGASKRKLRGLLRVQYAHLGDSRLYLIRGSAIRQISIDHTMLQKLLESGILSGAEADNYAHKNVIYKSLNGDEKLALDPIQSFDLERGGVLLLCSDGLSNFVSPEDMIRVLQGTPTLDQAVNYMVHLANARGGDDNISVLMLEHGGYERQKNVKLDKLPRLKRKSAARRKRVLLAALFALLAVSAGMLYLEVRSGHIPGSGVKTGKLSKIVKPSRPNEKAGTSSKPTTNQSKAIEADRLPPEETTSLAPGTPAAELAPSAAKQAAQVAGPEQQSGSAPSRTLLLRSDPTSLSELQAKQLFKDRGFFSRAWNPGGGVSGEAKREVKLKQETVVVDDATGLAWDSSWSDKPLTYDKAKRWIKDLNKKGFAGFKDWRLPTVEEAASLLESIKKNGKLNISPLFSPTQKTIWTCDAVAEELHKAWAIDFEDGNPCRKNVSEEKATAETCSVRAVRSNAK